MTTRQDSALLRGCNCDISLAGMHARSPRDAQYEIRLNLLLAGRTFLPSPIVVDREGTLN
jgi:hypothetical protein